jgi:predicted GIY-YIG superfamily endonuclease
MILYVICIVLALLALIIVPRYFAIQGGKTFYEGRGLTEFSQNTNELVRYIKRVFKHIRKIVAQYTFHLFVRMLYYVQLLLNRAYAFARDRFMKSTIPDKKAVSRFWEYLKEYKQEIDQEKKKK